MNPAANSSVSEGGELPGDERSCKRPAREFGGDGYRPSDLLGSFFRSAIAMFVAGAVAILLTASGIAGDDGRWIAIHLFLLGGVSLLILGAAQFFSTAFLATDPPTSSMVHAQLLVWIFGVLCVVASVPTGITPLADVGGLAVLCGLALFAIALRQLERRSLQTARWAIRWYYACAVFLSVGLILGVALVHGVEWTRGDLLTAHLAVNIAGWLGTAIVGTLHTFFPSLTHGQLRHPRLQGPTFIAWTSAVALLAAGAAFDTDAAIVGGWSALTIAALLLMANIVSSAITATPPITLAARLVGTAQLFLPAGLIVALAMVAVEGPAPGIWGEWRFALACLVGLGWVGMTVTGSMLHLLAVLARVKNFLAKMPEPRRTRDIALAAAISAAICALALTSLESLESIRPFALAALLILVAPVFGQIGALAKRALSPAPPRVRRLQSDR